MDVVFILVGLFVLYEVLSGQATSALNSATSTTGAGVNPVPQVADITQSGKQVTAPVFSLTTPKAPSETGLLIGSGVSTGISVTGALLSSIGSSAASAIPIVGAAFSLIFNSLMQASAKRAAAARSENSAVAQGVPAWDAGISQIVSAYNTKGITAAQASSLLDTVMSNFWNEVKGQIQSGRNGCGGGSTPAPLVFLSGQAPGINVGTQTQATGSTRQCSGDFGAACCVGNNDLMPGIYNIKLAIATTEKTKAAATGYVPKVYASKYGGIDREIYMVTVTKPK